MIESSVLAVFLVGLLGGAHCAGMCGGIAGLIGARSRRGPVAGQAPAQAMHFQRNPSRAAPLPSGLTPSLAGASSGIAGARVPGASRGMPGRSGVDLVTLTAYNIGRISTYTALGAVAAAVGSSAWLLPNWLPGLPVGAIAMALTSLLMLLMGLYVMGFERPALFIEAAGRPLWRRIAPLAGRTLSASTPARALAAGALWGLLPCGMVYGVLMLSLATGSALQGAALMFAFGLGTLPNLMLLGFGGHWLTRATSHRAVRLGAGSVIIVAGLIGVLYALTISGAG